MAGQPLYLVTSIKKHRKQASANAYSGRHTTEPMWQVRMISGFFPGVGVTLSYPDKNKADAFSPFEICNPSTLIDNIASKGEPFTVNDIYKTKGFGAKNLYTDKRPMLDSWQVELEGPSGTFIDMWYPSQAEAYQFSIGWTLKTQDLFGTLRAPLFEIGTQLEAIAASARHGTPPTPVPHPAPIATYPYHQPGPPLGTPPAPLGATTGIQYIQGLPDTTHHPANQPLVFVQYFVTNGGAAGYYTVRADLSYRNPDPALGDIVGFFNTGTFTYPFNGYFTGEFDALNASGGGNYILPGQTATGP